MLSQHPWPLRARRRSLTAADLSPDSTSICAAPLTLSFNTDVGEYSVKNQTLKRTNSFRGDTCANSVRRKAFTALFHTHSHDHRSLERQRNRPLWKPGVPPTNQFTCDGAFLLPSARICFGQLFQRLEQILFVRQHIRQ